MASVWLSVVIFSTVSLCSECFVFDAEEIKSLNFVVDISDQPVLLSERPEEQTVQMYNRAGQPYSCQLPDTEALLQPHREDAEAGQHASVPSLLAPMSSGPCLQRTRDWWTYELCPMAEIRQYHLEDGQIVGPVSVLGRFESDYDWSGDDGRSRHAKHRYHSQTYVNGSDCDLTGRPRSAEVRYVCEEGGADALVRVDEPETCRYVLTVRTARLCAHRRLAPPPSRRPQPVTCRPALSAQQLQRLAEARLERARRDAERAAADRERRESARRERQRHSAESTAAGSRERSGDRGRSYLEKAKHLFDGIAAQTNKLGNVLDDVIHNYVRIVSEFNTEKEYGLERLHELQDRHRAAREHHAAHADRIRALFELADRGHYLTAQIVSDLLAYTDTLSVFSEVMVGISDESRRLKEFMSSEPAMVTDGTLGHLISTMASLSQLSVQLRRFFADTEVWQAELLTWQADLESTEDSESPEDSESLVDSESSAQGQSDPAVGDADPTDDSAEPADSESEEQATLEVLELLRTHSERSSGDRGSSSEDSGSSSEDRGSSSGDRGSSSEDRGSSSGDRGSSSEDRGSSSEDRGRSSVEDGPLSSEDSVEDDTEDEDEDDDLDGSADSPKKKRVKFSTLRSLGLDKMVQISEIDREQRVQIERAVKQKLQKVGLDTNGPEIKVRFLKFPDVDHLDRDHTLSEEEMAAFENALIAVMMGGNEALVEHEKHSQQAANYEYSFERAVNDLESEPGPADGGDEQPPAADPGLFTLV